MRTYRSLDPVPTSEECALAVAKAVGARRNRHRGTAGQSAGDIAEATEIAVTETPTGPRMVVSGRGEFEGVWGITLCPQQGRDGWWRVGEVIDEIADAEFEVWYIPGSRRIGVGRSKPRAVSFTAN